MIFLSKINSEIAVEEPVIPGSQTFTSSGTFVAPYTTTYNIVISGSLAKSGNGGKGGNSYRKSSSYNQNTYQCGGGGGGGGSAAKPPNYTLFALNLSKGEQIVVTVNKDLVSFGSYSSCSTGVTPSNGGDGANYSSEYRHGGSGGSMGTRSIISGEILPSPMPLTVDGKSGSDGNDGSGYHFSGAPTTNHSHGPIPGGKGGQTSQDIYGGDGSSAPEIRYPDRNAYAEEGEEGSSSIIGNIVISWGDN